VSSASGPLLRQHNSSNHYSHTSSSSRERRSLDLLSSQLCVIYMDPRTFPRLTDHGERHAIDPLIGCGVNHPAKDSWIIISSWTLWCVFESAMSSSTCANDTLLQDFLCSCVCLKFYAT
jgi:hypothetical protein